jgi:hypothetical protein
VVDVSGDALASGVLERAAVPVPLQHHGSQLSPLPGLQRDGWPVVLGPDSTSHGSIVDHALLGCDDGRVKMPDPLAQNVWPVRLIPRPSRRQREVHAAALDRYHARRRAEQQAGHQLVDLVSELVSKTPQRSGVLRRSGPSRPSSRAAESGGSWVAGVGYVG